ncbi:MAG: ribosome biogenesis GTPase Der [Sedimentisphaerales bacterium]|nr:ribosome biogenesis GTPase Der [Sedimentisphaerales bacterium]
MAIPIVAIIGRPNVGKSSLLNVLARERISIVEDTPGVTRDRVSALIEMDGRYFEMVDTGGYGIVDHDNLTAHVENQIQSAITKADVVLFIVDIRSGVMPLDIKVAQILRKEKLNVILVANKADSPELDYHTGEFHKLGFGEPLCISALHARRREELIDRIFDEFDGMDTAKPEKEIMKIAVVGKRNVGKSTFINSLAGEERVIVSNIPGTTRDAVDIRFEKDGHTFVVIDTAGVRKKSKMNDANGIEFYSFTRSIHAIRRADVCLFFVDSTAPISQVDKKLARFIIDSYKPVIIVVNKWDLVKNRASTEDFADYFDKVLPGLKYAPICFITAKESRNVNSLVDLASNIFKQARTKVGTGRINKAIQTITAEKTPSSRRKVGIPRIYYGTQVAVNPPTLVLFVNDPEKIDDNYQRFFTNRLRDIMPWGEVPIRLIVRARNEKVQEEFNFDDVRDLRDAISEEQYNNEAVEVTFYEDTPEGEENSQEGNIYPDFLNNPHIADDDDDDDDYDDDFDYENEKGRHEGF